MNVKARFLAACARRPVDRTPVWMMRQAGRYLPEYRAIRQRVDFLTLCKTPELAAEVSLQPLRRFGMDACIVFSDILIPVEAMGARVEFGDGGPQLASPVRDLAAVDRLTVPDPEEKMSFVLETLRRLRAALADDAALVGFVGAPFTLASYLVEGGGSKNFALTKSLMYSQPQTFDALLAKLADTIARYAAAQIAAGAQAVQVFDTWAGELDPPAYERFALPYQKVVVDTIRQHGVPAILFVNGCAGKLTLLAKTGAEVLSVDWRIGLDRVRAELGDRFALQGNVDPCALLSSPQIASQAANAAMLAAGGAGHILNLGHGILPSTPLECARSFVESPRALAVPA
ncbi:MAG: uroporphyrinogen decarboxylase [Candidatus Eremiobacteraeota bacterium]|nr:uroporphyrinogen decarboxylase [Candidatus Eremiobacteraeota bacterium]MBC5827857.1 uroporphyrinogen decarboxylase [Candidatus Eremiobacteraeota bacterium]